MAIFNTKNKKYNLETKMFLDFDNATPIARYDLVKYPQFEILTQRQLGFFWRPEEIDLTRDIKDFRDLSDHEKHIFTSNLRRQIVLDSVQGRAPQEIFAPIATLPELENFAMVWGFSETIHSRSYTHVIRNVYPNPSIIFDGILDLEEIVDCAKDISKYYDELQIQNDLRNIYDNRNIFERLFYFAFPTVKAYKEYEHKKAIWMALNAVNALEGIRFYVSFACSWNFAELKKMEGNAKIIKMICRDENVHLAATQKMLDLLPKDDSDFAQIKEECQEEVLKMFDSVVEQEKKWADYLFKDGSMMGLNANILKDYVEFIAHRRLRAIGLPSKYDTVKSNPLPWTLAWISGQSVQVAPQETENDAYIVGGIRHDIDDSTFNEFSLD